MGGAGRVGGLSPDVLGRPPDDGRLVGPVEQLAAQDADAGGGLDAQGDAAALRADHGDDHVLAEHKREWLGPLDGRVSEWSFRQGFVEDVSVHAPLFVAEAERLFGLTPLRSARLFGAGEVTANLADCPFLSRLRGLDLFDNGLT